jgi:hypothetical protein
MWFNSTKKALELFRHDDSDSLYNPCPKCIDYLSKDNLVLIINMMRGDIQELKAENKRLYTEIDTLNTEIDALYINDRNKDE